MKIFDTSSIVCLFREAECPQAFEICRKNGYEIAITKQVYGELKDNPDTFKMFNNHNNFVIIDDVHEGCISKISARYPWMHDGELSVVCAGIHRKNSGNRYHCIIDEKARKLRDIYDLKMNGTIGMLMWQKNQLQELTLLECEKIYHKIKASPFWISDDIIRGLLK